MADTFFGFDTSLSRDEDCSGNLEELEEQEYDALNDETFGDADSTAVGAFEDWEAQHEQLAQITEDRRKSVQQSSLDLNLKLDDDDDESINSDEFIIPERVNFFKTKPRTLLQPNLPPPNTFPNGALPKNVCTVEELERGLLTNQNQNVATTSGDPKPYNFIQNPPPRFPPGLGSMLLQPGYMPPGLNAQNSANLFRFMTPPHPLLMQQRPGVNPPGMHNMPPPGLPPPNLANVRHNMAMKNQMAPNHLNRPNNFPVAANQNFKNFRPEFQQQSFQPYNHLRQQPQQFHLENYNMQQQFQHNTNRGLNNRNNNYYQNQQQQQLYHHLQHQLQQENKDEYAGLMSTREKQWLINIQLLQLNTGTPYFDDFYYTVFVDRQTKLEKENRPMTNQEHFRNKFHNYHNNNRQNRKDDYSKDDRMHRDRDNNPTQVHKTYTPLQFENSLGKLQYGSVTAPRKIIDMDIVPHEKENELNLSQTSVNLQRDLRKTKQTLLELEGLFGLVLRLEDLNNPIAISNTLKLREIKEKQKIQQLETATTEEKEEILKALQEDSLVKNDNRDDLLTKIFNGLLFEDKLCNYMGVRKGKVLLLRLLPHLSKEYFDKHLELWIKIISSIPINGRKDQLTDNLLPQFFHFFERFVEQLSMECILKIVTTLIEMRKAEKTTPPARNLLLLVLCNQFGISCIAKLITQAEQIFVRLQVTETQRAVWCEFLQCLLDSIEVLVSSSIQQTSPMQIIDNCVMETHLKHTLVIQPDKFHLFLNVFCIKK